jgi:hypothetical protein
MAASVAQWSELLATNPEVRVRFPALQNFLRSNGSATAPTQPRECNQGQFTYFIHLITFAKMKEDSKLHLYILFL